MKNKIFSVLLVALLLVSTAAAAKTFSDVEGHWAEPYVQQMTDTGLINGFEDGTFRPDASVTRADALVLISRALGSADKTVAEFSDVAYKAFSKDVEGLGYAGYEKGFAHLLYNDVYTKEELTRFLENDLGRTPLKRYEAAIVLVKLLGQEDTALENTMPILDYADTEEIPANAQAYVELCGDIGIMQGVGDNKFSPNTEVTRGQMAKMICTAIEQLDLSYVQGTVTGYDDKLKEITYSTDDGRDITMEILTDYIVKRDAVDVLDTSVIKTGDRINVTLSGEEVKKIELVSVKPNLAIEGIFVKYIPGEEVSQIEVKATEASETTTLYNVAKDCKVIWQTWESDLASFEANCHIAYELKDNVVISITGKRSEIWREGVIEGFIYGSPSMLEISLEDGTKEKYEYDAGLKVWRDDAETTINNLYKGDKVVVGIYYNKIRFLTAKSESVQVTGTIKKIVISATEPAITISTETGDKAYDLSGKDLAITIKDKNVTTYDLRLGYKVEVTIVGRTVTKINVTEATVTEKFTLTGTVSNVNATYKNITVKDTDGNESTIFVNDTTVIIDSKTGQAVEFANIPAGATVISIVSPEKLNNVAISIAIITE